MQGTVCRKVLSAERLFQKKAWENITEVYRYGVITRAAVFFMPETGNGESSAGAVGRPKIWMDCFHRNPERANTPPG